MPKQHQFPYLNLSESLQQLFQEQLLLNIRFTLVEILEEEVSEFLHAALYQHTAERKDYRNGYYTRNLVTTAGEIEDLPVPRTRHGFRTELFERYHRRQAELDQAILDMFVKGVSMEQVGGLVETLIDTHPSPSTVSRVFHTLEGEFESWKKRPLKTRYLYAFADGTYFTVIYDQTGCKMPILAVIGIDEEGRAIFYQSSREKADQEAAAFIAKYEKTYPTAVDCLTRPGNLPDVLQLSRETLEVHPHQQHHRASVQRSQETQPQAYRRDGGCFPQRRQLHLTVLCGHP